MMVMRTCELAERQGRGPYAASLDHSAEQGMSGIRSPAFYPAYSGAG
jgi:hypothetical protein